MDAAFIFDLDGTLVDSMPYHVRAWAQLSDELGLGLSEAEVFARVFGISTREVARGLFGDRLSDAEQVRLGERKEAIFRAIYGPQMQAIPGALDFVRAAHARGIPLAIATGAGTLNTDFIVDTLGIRDCFGALVTADDVTHGKPHPEPFLAAAQRLGVPPARCLVFEDAPAGLASAQAAGMRAVALTTTHPAVELARFPAMARTAADFRGLSITDALALLE
ncbi:MAG: beta-phosphoglucomutase family hydrolase [Chloroflexi bacterium]|nr:beta-phosphoglucomutase family hydrolase [Chloroflexota bacterium]